MLIPNTAIQSGRLPHTPGSKMQLMMLQTLQAVSIQCTGNGSQPAAQTFRAKLLKYEAMLELVIQELMHKRFRGIESRLVWRLLEMSKLTSSIHRRLHLLGSPIIRHNKYIRMESFFPLGFKKAS